jgi:hypothetical protein
MVFADPTNDLTNDPTNDLTNDLTDEYDILKSSCYDYSKFEIIQRNESWFEDTKPSCS